MVVLAIALAIFTARPASAQDVLFMVNMNYSPQEMEAARKAAQARGQEFVVIPPEDTVKEADRVGRLRSDIVHRLKKLRPGWSEMTVNRFLYEVISWGTSSIDSDLRDKLGEKLGEYLTGAQGVHQKELYELGPINHQIQQKLQELKNAGKRVDTVVFSAHSDGPSLSGETSYVLTQSDLKSLKVQNPELFSDPRHVLLLGCYTNTETANILWRELFPGASLIAGFEGRSPLRTRPAASMFITDVLATANRLDRENFERSEPLAEKTVRDALRKLEAVRITYSAIDYCTHRVVGIPATNIRCDDRWLTLFALAQDIDRSYFADGRIPEKDPPHQASGTLLREFYNKLQALCPIEQADNIAPAERAEYLRLREVYRDRTIRLIFWWNVQGNFTSFHRNELKRIEEALEEAGIEAPLPTLNGETGRIEMMKKLYAIGDELQRKYEDAANKIRRLPQPTREASEEEKKAYQEQYDNGLAEMDKLQELGGALGIYEPLITLDARIPLNWVEPNTVF